MSLTIEDLSRLRATQKQLARNKIPSTVVLTAQNPGLSSLSAKAARNQVINLEPTPQSLLSDTPTTGNTFTITFTSVAITDVLFFVKTESAITFTVTPTDEDNQLDTVSLGTLGTNPDSTVGGFRSCRVASSMSTGSHTYKVIMTGATINGANTGRLRLYVIQTDGFAIGQATNNTVAMNQKINDALLIAHGGGSCSSISSFWLAIPTISAEANFIAPNFNYQVIDEIGALLAGTTTVSSKPSTNVTANIVSVARQIQYSSVAFTNLATLKASAMYLRAVVVEE